MAVSLSVVVAKDGAGTTIAGGLQAQDKSGAGTGPFTMAHIIIDGAAGTNVATVKAASTAAGAADPALVVAISPNNTVPVSLTSTTVTGTVAVTESGTWTVQPGNTPNTTPWLAKISDGTNAAAIKAASTAPVATDPALVVAISPNSVNANGSATSANSAPVVIASDQAAVTIKGAAASGAAASGNPVPAAGLAVSSETVVTNGQAAALVTDLARKLIVLPYANPENFVSGAITSSMTGTTSTSLVAAPAAGLRNYITQITISNAHATVGTDVIIQDGSGGTTLYTIPAAAVYGGATVTFPTPLRQPTTATAIFCANVTTGASTKVSASGYKGA